MHRHTLNKQDSFHYFVLSCTLFFYIPGSRGYCQLIVISLCLILSLSSPVSLLQMVLQAGHYDPEAIRSCAEKVAVHWQQLMLKMEDRLKLVNASVAFYKTSEQVHLERTRPTKKLLVVLSAL